MILLVGACIVVIVAGVVVMILLDLAEQDGRRPWNTVGASKLFRR